ncbi:MAG: hypothetical protein E7175_05170 [Erysipelotrichaceae bacterium]|nr:hypothetical protein [Erysipelotrichaceae bacterium]
MAHAIRVRRCFHCGAVLQTKNSKEPGYILESTIVNNKPDALLYCNRCYSKVKALNYSELDVDVDEDLKKILKDALATDAMMIWVVDLFAFNGVLNPDIVKIAKKLDVCVLATKRDLFPRVVKNEYLTRFLEERFNEYGIKPIATHIFGHESDINPKELLDKLNTLRKGRDIYMVGSVTSGKTTIINKILTGYVNKSKWAIKSEFYKDTKSKVLEVPLSNSSFLYELPGFPLSTSTLSKVEKENVKALTPRKSIKVSQRSMIKNDAILAGNLVQFSMIKGKPCIVKLYAAEGVEIKKCKIVQIPEVLEENNRKRNIRPYSENFTDFSDYDVFDYEMENDGKFHDISIQGFGWFTFVGKGQVFRVQFPKGVAVKEYLSKVRSDA